MKKAGVAPGLVCLSPQANRQTAGDHCGRGAKALGRGATDADNRRFGREIEVLRDPFGQGPASQQAILGLKELLALDHGFPGLNLIHVSTGDLVSSLQGGSAQNIDKALEILEHLAAGAPNAAPSH